VAGELLDGRTFAGLPSVEVAVRRGLARTTGVEELGLAVGSLEMDLAERRR
jgi:hypothetical protein